MNRASRQTLQRKQLDEKVAKAAKVRPEVPPGGWVRAIAEALGMSTRQLATRIGIAQPSLMGLVKGEEEGTISLKTLRKAADALGCELSYVLIPRSGSLEKVVREQAERTAKKMVAQTSHSMELEEQGIPEQDKNAQARELAEKLVRELPKSLWGDK